MRHMRTPSGNGQSCHAKQGLRCSSSSRTPVVRVCAAQQQQQQQGDATFTRRHLMGALGLALGLSASVPVASASETFLKSTGAR